MQLTSKTKTKKGAAALYIVLFTTIILSIISLSFTRVMITATDDTTNNDLSQSAYDSALAGIEDAKIALMKYHDCINAGYTAVPTGNECQKVISAMQEGIKSNSCDVVQQALGRVQDQTEETGGGVMIQETSGGVTSGDEMVQSYTCVKIMEEVQDYRTTLSSADRVRMIPIRTGRNAAVKSVKISWFSEANYLDYDERGNIRNVPIQGNSTTGKHNLNRSAMVLPILGVDIYQTTQSYKIYDLNGANGGQTDHSKVWLYPVGTWSSNNTTVISAATFIENSDKDTDQNVSEVKCSHDINNVSEEGFYCSAYLTFPDPIGVSASNPRAEDTFFLRLTLPYGTPNTDVSVEIFTIDGEHMAANENNTSYEANNRVVLSGIQALIDSTGRANDVYRRIESRIEMVDTYFPYPEFEIQTTKNNYEAIDKDFYVTHDCGKADNGSVSNCSNYGTAGASL